jgi:hypothetical protein
MSINFRRIPDDPQLSQRVVLSVEVSPPAFHFLPSLLYLVLSGVSNGQAKRKKHSKENDEDTTYREAAQIFAEMLGQVCHPEFYEQMDNEYQDVGIRIRVSLFCIFIACYISHSRVPRLL